VAGQVAMDGDGRVIAGDVAAQWARALENVLAVVGAAGGDATHIGRMTIFVTDKAEYMAARMALGAVWRRIMGSHYPAMTLVEVKGLVEEGAVVEIEATAVIPD
jgi:enamine deaminase RidA (YjgF/YER057c/UK114 family)